ncbi:MAG TPA: DUF2066 domain-containing protein [Xanthomonadaceae bacterium]|nr:DUF2066 domain-containing protein [Xanthomonadaceae bacterium]
MMRIPSVLASGLSCATLMLVLLAPALAQPPSSSATPPPLSLREGEVPVADQSAEARQVALREALLQVLVRNSGGGRIAEDPLIRRSLADAPRLLLQHQYRQEVVSEPGSPPRLQLYLVARFDGDGVDRLLDQAGIRLWQTDRPTTLLLVEIDDGRERRLIGESESGKLTAFHRRARLRALPVIMPLLDLEEQIRLSPQALGAGLRDVLDEMGRRYGAPAVLHGRVTRLGDLWVSRWTVTVNSDTQHWESMGELDHVLRAGADGLGDALGQRYALSAAERLGGTYRLWVSGLHAPADYPRLMRYLAGNALVRDVVSERADGDRLLLRVHAGATLERLLQSLTLGFTLAHDPAAAPDAADAALLLLP